MKTEMPEIDELLTPLFVQARQEALKEANKIPLNRSGIVTSTPTKVAHLVKEAEIAINELTLKQVLEARIDENSFWFRVMGDGNIVTAHDHLERIADLRKELEDA